MNTLQPDPVAIFYATLSMYEKYTQSVPRLPETFGGEDQFIRAANKVATTFEKWACKHIDFEETTDVWPYLLHEKFGTVFYTRFNVALLLFSKEDCMYIAKALGLPLKRKRKTK
jgi:hypothetical protein